MLTLATAGVEWYLSRGTIPMQLRAALYCFGGRAKGYQFIHGDVCGARKGRRAQVLQVYNILK